MPNYMPGRDIALSKAQIAAVEGENRDPIEVCFNPKDIVVSKQIPWVKHKNVDRDQQVLEFTASEPKTLVCDELYFDLFEEPTDNDVYIKYISKIEKLMLIDEKLGRPPLCTFAWGELGISEKKLFQGVIEDLKVKYTVFLPNGIPCRATVSLTMKEAVMLLNEQQAAQYNKDKKPLKVPPNGANAHAGSLTGAQSKRNLEAGNAIGRDPDSRGFMRSEPVPDRQPRRRAPDLAPSRSPASGPSATAGFTASATASFGAGASGAGGFGGGASGGGGLGGGGGGAAVGGSAAAHLGMKVDLSAQLQNALHVNADVGVANDGVAAHGSVDAGVGGGTRP